MTRRSLTATVLCLVLIALLPTLLHPRAARGAEVTREFTLDTSNLYLGNLIGAVDVRPGSGNAFRIGDSVPGTGGFALDAAEVNRLAAATVRGSGGAPA